MLGILDGKWIVHFDWLKQCLDMQIHIDEAEFEVLGDAGGQQSGPILGRQQNVTKLLKGWEVISFSTCSTSDALQQQNNGRSIFPHKTRCETALCIVSMREDPSLLGHGILRSSLHSVLS